MDGWMQEWMDGRKEGRRPWWSQSIPRNVHRRWIRNISLAGTLGVRASLWPQFTQQTHPSSTQQPSKPNWRKTHHCVALQVRANFVQLHNKAGASGMTAATPCTLALVGMMTFTLMAQSSPHIRGVYQLSPILCLPQSICTDFYPNSILTFQH
jgi:hypothetical protein